MSHTGQVPDCRRDRRHERGELAEYARSKGLYAEQIADWRDACVNANGGIAKEAARLNKELKTSEKERRRLEKELARKDKALAEAAPSWPSEKKPMRSGGAEGE